MAAGLPGGSWYESCSPMSWSGTVLTAYCGLLTSSGGQQLSTIDTTLCASGSALTNIGNELSCVTIAPNLPGGLQIAVFKCDIGELLIAVSKCDIGGLQTAVSKCDIGGLLIAVSKCDIGGLQIAVSKCDIGGLLVALSKCDIGGLLIAVSKCDIAGTWTESCEVVAYSEGILEATCGAPNKAASNLNYTLCPPTSLVSNDYATLAAPGPSLVPRGSASTQAVAAPPLLTLTLTSDPRRRHLVQVLCPAAPGPSLVPRGTWSKSCAPWECIDSGSGCTAFSAYCSTGGKNPYPFFSQIESEGSGPRQPRPRHEWGFAGAAGLRAHHIYLVSGGR
eukprot:gene28608-31777_t